MTGMTATAHWAEALQQWAIPEEILASAPESPWGFPTQVFTEAARQALADPPTPTHESIVEVMPVGGLLLDVGCGSGAASLPVAPPAGLIIGVDEDPGMLQALAGAAAGRVAVELVAGRWPDVADQVGQADVTVSANVAYNVAALGPFLEKLTAASRRRVVLELSVLHPQSLLSPLWEHFWDLTRPTRPSADDAEAVVEEVIGVRPVVQRWQRSWSFMGERGSWNVAWIRRRLCLPASSDEEVAALLDQLSDPGPLAMVTLSWPGLAPGSP
jgi:SAM-dependent methyltransferase